MNRKVKNGCIPISICMLALIVYINADIRTASASKVGAALDPQLCSILDHPLLYGAIAGVSVRSAATGKILFEHNGDIRLRPASNLKLLTASAALNTLGETYKFHTEVAVDGRVIAHVLKGNVYLKGKGDPTLLEKDFNEMAADLKKKGINIIFGNVIGDDSWYDHERYSTDLPWTDETEYYGAQVSALTAAPDEEYDAGTVIVEVSPGKEETKKAVISITPATDYVKVINQVRTVGKDGKRHVTVQRRHGTNTIIAKGTVPLEGRKMRSWVAVWEPTGFALDLFKKSLKKQGITVAGRVLPGKMPDRANVLFTHESMTLSELMVPFMKLSNNSHAETLVKEMGKVKMGEGSWEKGLEIVSKNVKSFGISPASIVIRDGSGISHVNLISANQFTQLLYSIQNKDWFYVYRASLPAAGARGKWVAGTLKTRMMHTTAAGHVQAKTGSISTVSSLSGYVSGKSGESYVFSVLLNNVLDDEAVKKIEDEIAVVLANQ